MLLLAITALAAFFLFKIFKSRNYWAERGIPHVKPLPFFGSMLPVAFGKKNYAYVVQEIYESNPKARYIGYHEFLQPVLLVKDSELLKQIGVKDFDSFPIHDQIAPDGIDPLWSRNLLAVGEKKWKELRPTLSPSFTANKMRNMFGLFDEIAQQVVDHFEKEGSSFDVELKDVFTRFTNDVIASAAFGLKCDSLKEKENEFYLAGKDATDFSGWRVLKFFMFRFSPMLMKFLKVQIINKPTADFFRSIIRRNIKEREDKKIIRPDMIHLLLQARKDQQDKDDQSKVAETGFATAQESDYGRKATRKDFTDEDITAQALIFFLAGFETSSTLMSHAIYELAQHPEIQRRLREEIGQLLRESQGELTYEGVARMKYLDMVVSETLRKWPPVSTSDRVSTQRYVIEPRVPGERPLVLEPGASIALPIYPIHMDPEIYPEPEKFDPERFNEANRGSINQSNFLPFGIGPRNCIGSRFALLESKVLIARLLKRFEFEPTERSQIPLRIKGNSISMHPEEGFWLRCKRIRG